MNAPDNRQHTLQLFLHAHRLMAGARGFTAYINNIGTFGRHLERMLYRSIRLIPQAPVGKRVGGYIQDAHNQCAVS
ncbi:hypothetical protein D3C85_1419000 [compost metagenome]